MIVAAYYQTDLSTFSTSKFLSLVFAWLYDNATRMDHARDLEHWKKNYDQYFSIHGSGLDVIEQTQQELGIKPAVVGQEATINLRSMLPKMKPAEAGEYQGLISRGELPRGDYAAAEEWLKNKRGESNEDSNLI